MSAYTYKCRECGAEFDEPYQWVERHGFTCGPFEPWSACPYCGSCDYDESYIVEHEEEIERELAEEDEEAEEDEG